MDGKIKCHAHLGSRLPNDGSIQLVVDHCLWNLEFKQLFSRAFEWGCQIWSNLSLKEGFGHHPIINASQKDAYSENFINIRPQIAELCTIWWPKPPFKLRFDQIWPPHSNALKKSCLNSKFHKQWSTTSRMDPSFANLDPRLPLHLKINDSKFRSMIWYLT